MIYLFSFLNKLLQSYELFFGWVTGQQAPLPSSPLDKWAKAILSEKRKRPMADAYFGAGSTVERIIQVAKENNLALNQGERNAFQNMETMQQSLAGNVLQGVLLKTGASQEQTRQIFLEAPAGLKKLPDSLK